MKTLQRSVHMIAALGAALFTTVLAIPALAQDCPELVGDVPGNAGCGIVVSGDIAYVVRCPNPGPRGLDVYDLSDPTDPVHVGELDEPMWGFDSDHHAVSEDHLFVAAGWLGLRVVDVSDPGEPVEVGGHPGGGNVRAVAVSGTLAYVADSNSGLLVIDVSNPSSPELVGSVPLSSWVDTVAVAGEYAYVAGSELVVIDVSNPSDPLIVTTVPGEFGFGASDVAVAGTYAYVTEAYFLNNMFGKLRIIDVGEPSAPEEVGVFDEFSGLLEVEVSQHFAYVLVGFVPFGGDPSLAVVDVQSPNSPLLVGATSLWFRTLAISNGYVYVPDILDGGLEVFRDCASVFSDGFESGDTSAWSAPVP